MMSKSKPVTAKRTREEYLEQSTCTSKCIYHVIFTPKYRRSVLVGKIAMRLKKLISEKGDEFGYVLHKLVVEPDHVHLIIQCPPDPGIGAVVGKIKSYTAMVLRREFVELTTRLPCLWTRSKFVMSVGEVDNEVIDKYIHEQKNV
jgi:putative transposase